ncbi:AI-2E family transporter [Streptosporangium lutulentum]
MPRVLIVLLCTAGVVVTLVSIREIGSIVGPVLLALVLVLAVSPVRTWLQKHGAPGWTLVAVPLIIVLSVLLGMVAILTVAVVQMATLAPTYDTQFNQLVVEAQRLAQRLGIGTKQMNEALTSFDPGKIFELAQGSCPDCSTRSRP